MKSDTSVAPEDLTLSPASAVVVPTDPAQGEATLSPSAPITPGGAKRRSFGNIAVLDGVRATAILLVLVAHAGLDKLVPGGLGVTVFFFLSGYLITTLMRAEMQNTGKLNIPKFYLRRALRIFPPLYITLTLFLVLVLVKVVPADMDARIFRLHPVGLETVEPDHLTFGAVLMQYIHLANYTNLLGMDGDVPSMPLWSLAVEEHFYLIFPVCYMLLAHRWSGKKQGMVLGIFCALALLIRIATVAVMHDYHEVYNWTHTRFDSILFGCILAVTSNPVMDQDEQSYIPSTLHFVLALGLMLFCLAVRVEAFRQTARYTLQGLALFVIFSWLLRLKTGWIFNLLTSKPMKLLGVLSYTVYLTNFFLFNTMKLKLPNSPHAVQAGIALAATFAYAGLMHLIIERPLGRLRSKMH